MSGSTNKPSHLRALLKKNWIIWRRSCCVSLLEIIIPVLFVFFLVLFKSVFPTDDMPLTDYLTKPGYQFEYDGALTAADSQYFKDCSADKNGGVVALIPQGDALIEDIKTLLEGQLGMTTQYFTSIDEINTFTSRTDYASTPNLRLCFGVVVTQNNNVAHKYSYTLLFNSTQLDNDDQDVPQTGNPRISELEREDTDSLNQYGRSGFLALQNMIDNLILRAETGASAANIYNEVTSMMVPPYVKDDLALNLKGQTRLFLDLPLLLPFLRFINGMVTEKEKRIREGMKIMGLTNAAFYLSWFITYGIIFTIISLLVTIISVAGFFKLSSFGYIFLWHWEFTMCLIALGFFISIFFSKAKQANVAGFVVALLLGFFQEFASSDSRTKGAVIGASIAPEASLGLAADHILSLEAAQLGLTHESAGVVINNYRIAYHYVLMLVDIIVLLVLGSYLDQVLPSEFGIRKHPLFCCMRKRSNKLKKRNSQISDEADNMLEGKENFEETDPILKAQDSTHESVMVQGLRKVYSTGKLAVDRVSFSMYKNQIFVLLGHNGAGKTSTISMITGLFSSTEGTTKVFGMDNQVHLDEIRKTMGVCPQHDILFDNMTVREHLQLYSVFKGVDPKEAPAEIEKIISDIGLAEKRDYLAKNLSGGQKRKLSIGIAFLGGSKFIILDEPSSGMDTSARRKLWDMLKNYKQDRVVLLTTHFMDEADYLGDRIGIMGEGKLKCLGRSLFLKSKFGVGYNLTLVKKDINDPSKPIKEVILKHVPEGKVLSDVSAEVALQLPSAAAPKFQALFDELDKNLEKLRVSSYGISETTLEEVFLNVAKITTPEKHFQKDESPEAKIQMAEEDDLDEFDIRKDGMHGNWDLFKTHFSALVLKRVQYFKRDKRGLICEVFLPILMVIVGILLSKIDFEQSNPALTLVDDLYGYKFQVDYNDISATSTGYSNFISNFNSADFAMTAKPASTTLAAFDQEVFNDQGQDILDSPVNVFSFYMDTYDETNHNYKYTTFINTRAQEGTAFAMNKINNAILQRATGNPNFQISVTTLSFKKTENEKTFDNVVSGAIFAFVFSIGMSFIPASVVTFMVKEREMNVKHQQVVSGVSLFAYWFANYFVDIVKYLIPAIVNSLIAMAFNASSLIDGTKLSGLWAVFLLYGFSVIPFVYLLSFLFRNYGTAQIASFFINFGPGFIGGVAIGILKLIDSTRSAGQALQWILRILPTFAMTNGFLNLANREALAVAEGKVEPSAVWSADLTGGDVLFLVIGAILFTILIFVVEHLKNKQSLSSMMTGESKVPYVPKEMDDDVKREELEVEQSDNKTYAIKVDKLRKVYALEGGKHKVAVDRVSFGVRNGECFALLGVNGAGKTTTFKILSGDYLQTSGNAYINGYTIPGQMEEARKDIGYCPQFDALLDNLTAKEHLELYAAIKGIPKNYRSRLVDKQLREMNLKQYENVLAGTYSGGNKRKLSVAIAMIGNPAVVFLDEPSTGMDPEARRFMWNVISRISRERKQSSVILTTHSMEEAEALATKMGIMVNGGLKCLGTSQHIKNKFGGGYEIEVKLNLPHQQEISGALKSVGCKNGQRVDRSEVEQMLEKMNMANLRNELTEEGSGSAVHAQLQHGTAPIELVLEWILIETNGDKLMNFLHENFGQMTVMEHFQSFFRFQTTGFVTIGKFFGALEANKNALNILQYSIRQTTIEQIFNNFATEKVHVRVESRGEISIPVENRAEIPTAKNPQN